MNDALGTLREASAVETGYRLVELLDPDVWHRSRSLNSL